MKKRPRSGSQAKHGRGPRRSPKLRVLYEDDAVIAIDKPSGLAAVPVKGTGVASALVMLAEELKPRRQRALVVHRIDRFTSGVMLVAKTERDRQALIRQFLAHTPVREYVAVVRGNLKAEAETLVHYLRKEGMVQKVASGRDRGGTRAELRYRVERRLRGATLVRVTLVTGLQNQIRVQFSALGHPVIGDRKYHPAEASERKIDRVALHAARLEFVHPRTGKSVSIDCELAADMKALIEGLTAR